jgi:hypothetical protein
MLDIGIHFLYQEIAADLLVVFKARTLECFWVAQLELLTIARLVLTVMERRDAPTKSEGLR